MIRDLAHWDRCGRESLQSPTDQMPWMKFFEPRPGSTILELGCHKGANLLKWARDGHVSHGVDPSQSCIDTFYDSRDNLIDEDPHHPGLRCHAQVDFGESFDGANAFDHVVLASVLESVDDPLPLLRAVERSLKPDGEAYITTLSRWFNGKGPTDTQARFYTKRHLKLACKEVGLTVTRMETAGTRREPYFIILWARRKDANVAEVVPPTCDQ